MNAIVKELLYCGGELPSFPSPPNIAPLSRELTIYVGRRSDQQSRSVNPSTVFEMELDAEVQELALLSRQMQATVDSYLGRHRQVTTVRTVAFAALWPVSLIFVFCLIWGVRFLEDKKTSDRVAVTTPKAAASAPATQPVASAPLAPASPAVAATAPSSSAPFPSVVKETPHAVEPLSVPAPAAVLSHGVVARVTTKAALPTVPAKTLELPPEAIKSPPTTTVSDTATPIKSATAANLDQKIFVLEEGKVDQASTVGKVDAVPDASAKVTTAVKRDNTEALPKQVGKVAASKDEPRKDGPPIAKRPPVARQTREAESDFGSDVAVRANSSESTAAKTEKYGSTGVITLTPNAAIVYDTARKAQRMVPIGGKMPDGSTLKSVDAKTSRISTDRGDVVFD